MIFQAVEEHSVKDEKIFVHNRFYVFLKHSPVLAVHVNIRSSRGFTVSVIFFVKYCTITQIITISLRMKVHKNAIRHLQFDVM